jgi:hypothetical protein
MGSAVKVKGKRENGLYGFNIITRDTTYDFSLETEKQLEEWILAIRLVCESLAIGFITTGATTLSQTHGRTIPVGLASAGISLSSFFFLSFFSLCID